MKDLRIRNGRLMLPDHSSTNTQYFDTIHVALTGSYATEIRSDPPVGVALIDIRSV